MPTEVQTAPPFAPQNFTEQRTPYAFDLSRERELILQHGDEYWPFFKAQTTYYLKETYGKVRTSVYEHEIREDKEGNPQLWFGEGAMARRAKISYLTPVLDDTLPIWYRERALADVDWVERLEGGLLKDTPTGTMFVDLSPTPTDVDEEEKKKWAFNKHSFIRLHQIAEEKGSKKLLSVALRHYLAPEEQEKLFFDLTGKTGVKLGRIELLEKGLSIGAIQSITQRLYDNTPLERRIEVPQEDLVYKSEQEMNKFVEEGQKWLFDIFALMKSRLIQDEEIEVEFRGFEQMIKDAAKNRKEGKQLLNQISLNYARDDAATRAMMDGFIRRPYLIQDLSDCGFGSGFGKKSSFMNSSITGGFELRAISPMAYASVGIINNPFGNEEDEKYGFDDYEDCVICKETKWVGPCDICEGCESTLK